MTRAAQGMYGGPEMLRQYQVRQLMAPFQAMGMQMPIMAEQRRQELLQALERDMEMRRQFEAQQAQSKAEQIRSQIYAPPGAPGYWQQQPATPPSLGGQIQPQGPLDRAIAPALFSGMGGFQAQQPGVPEHAQFMPYPPEILQQWAQAAHPERAAGAGLAEARAAEQRGETTAGMPAAKVGAEKALTTQREARATESLAKAKLDRIKGEKAADYSKFSAQFNAAQKEWKKVDDRISELEATGGQGMSPQALQEMRNRNDAELETAKANIDQARGRPGESAAEAARQKAAQPGRGGLVAPQAAPLPPPPPPVNPY